MTSKPNDGDRAWRLTSIGAYMLCSSVMLIANKLTIHHIPTPSCVFAFQLAASVGFILSLRALSWLSVDRFTLSRVKTFLPYIGAFTLSVYCNGKALEHSNVETVIVFRSCTPMFVSVIDWLLLGRELPSRRSVASLACVAAGATGYVFADSEFKFRGFRAYGWVTLYTAAIVFEMTYGKQILGKVDFQTPVWGAVLYTNALGLLPMLAIAIFSGEASRLTELEVTDAAALWLLMSSMVGVGIGWSGWNCRNVLSAAAYTLVGVTCKLLTVLLSVTLLDKHASPAGICSLSVCLGAGMAYQQAPLRQGDDAEKSNSSSIETVTV